MIKLLIYFAAFISYSGYVSSYPYYEQEYQESDSDDEKFLQPQQDVNNFEQRSSYNDANQYDNNDQFDASDYQNRDLSDPQQSSYIEDQNPEFNEVTQNYEQSYNRPNSTADEYTSEYSNPESQNEDDYASRSYGGGYGNEYGDKSTNDYQAQSDKFEEEDLDLRSYGTGTSAYKEEQQSYGQSGGNYEQDGYQEDLSSRSYRTEQAENSDPQNSYGESNNRQNSDDNRSYNNFQSDEPQQTYQDGNEDYPQDKSYGNSGYTDESNSVATGTYGAEGSYNVPANDNDQDYDFN